MIITGTADEHLLNRCSTNNSNSNNNLTMGCRGVWEAPICKDNITLCYTHSRLSGDSSTYSSGDSLLYM